MLPSLQSTSQLVAEDLDHRLGLTRGEKLMLLCLELLSH